MSSLFQNDVKYLKGAGGNDEDKTQTDYLSQVSLWRNRFSLNFEVVRTDNKICFLEFWNNMIKYEETNYRSYSSLKDVFTSNLFQVFYISWNTDDKKLS